MGPKDWGSPIWQQCRSKKQSYETRTEVSRINFYWTLWDENYTTEKCEGKLVVDTKKIKHKTDCQSKETKTGKKINDILHTLAQFSLSIAYFSECTLRNDHIKIMI